MCGLCGMPSNGHVWSVHVSHTCDATHLGSPIASSCAGRKSTLGRRDRSENCLLCEPHTIDAITCHRKAVCAVLCCAVLCCLAANVTTVQHRLALHRGTLYSCSYVGIASATICYICYIWVRMSAAIAMPPSLSWSRTGGWCHASARFHGTRPEGRRDCIRLLQRLICIHRMVSVWSAYGQRRQASVA